MDIAVIPGHSPSSPGASFGGVGEFPLVHALAQSIKNRTDVQVVYRPDEENGLSMLVNKLNQDIQPDAALSLHLNAVEGDSPDKAYAIYNSQASKELAKKVDMNEVAENRISPVKRTDLYLLRETEFPVTLDESGYIDRWDHQRKFIQQVPTIADKYANILNKF